MEKATFRITKMDCPSEENLVRMQLDNVKAVKSLDFDIPHRQLVVLHNGELDKIESSIKALKFRFFCSKNRASRGRRSRNFHGPEYRPKENALDRARHQFHLIDKVLDYQIIFDQFF